ncbi:tyrosine-type recombinase/integrase [Lysinibacillus macroides]|uniref:tyrosine-type recombinase/integrase n=2 Tax=Lysinibacillus macroides TaxID=33935 RepID=UPI0039943539
MKKKQDGCLALSFRKGELYGQTSGVKESGEPLTHSSMKYNTRKLQETLEIPFNFHSLRHTHATMLMENGAKIKDIQARLGHSRSAITIDTSQKRCKRNPSIFLNEH